MLFFIIVAAGVFFGLKYDIKLDWTKDKELLLWYNAEENGVKTRKFIKLIK